MHKSLRYVRRMEGMISNGGKLEKSVLSFVLTHRLAGMGDRLGSTTNGGQRPRPSSVAMASSSRDPGPGSTVQDEHHAGEVAVGEPANHEVRCEVEVDELAASVLETQGADLATSRTKMVVDRPCGESSVGGSHASLSASMSGSQMSSRLACSSREVAIAMKELQPLHSSGYVPPPSVDDEDLESQCGPGSASSGEAVAMPVWGYPLTALWFMHDLEEFQTREVSEESPNRDLYALLPNEFLQLSRVVSYLDASSGELRLTQSGGSWSGQHEGESGACGSHFFWLEMLYEFHSGRRFSHAAEGANSATDPSWTSCMHPFDIDQRCYRGPDSTSRGAGCALL